MADASITPEVQPHPSAQRLRFRQQTLVKLGVIGALALVLLIPLAILGPVIEERARLRDGAVEETMRDWGRSQTVLGPILVIPTDTGYAYAFPDELRIDGDLTPEERSRGIYTAIVYRARLAIAGAFHRPTAAELGVAPEQIRWERAFIALPATDLRGTGTEVALQWGGAALPMLPGSMVAPWTAGLHVPVTLPASGDIAFSVELPLHGSAGIRFAPLAIRNSVRIRSSWPNPKFNGAFLPSSRSVDASGFSAEWTVSYYGRDFGQHGTELPVAIDNTTFGVELLPGIDSYRSVERSVTYGVLFIVLAFMSCFLFEVIARVRIHPFQYVMVGLALLVFFLVLLALSELVPFASAYAGAAGGTILLVTSYMLPVLKTGKRTLVATALLTASFAVLYVVLQAEDYALLAGSLVVFTVLAVTMRLTRALDWYAEDEATSSPPALPR